jgi:mannitol-specific phosphotransferase system IIBC component
MTKNEANGTYRSLISKPEISFWVPLILPLIGLAVAWGIITTKVSAIEVENANLRTLLERVIVLEEKDKALQEDITEIKNDVKYIRQQINK